MTYSAEALARPQLTRIVSNAKWSRPALSPVFVKGQFFQLRICIPYG
jgi:hypothetical protein